MNLINKLETNDIQQEAVSKNTFFAQQTTTKTSRFSITHLIIKNNKQTNKQTQKDKKTSKETKQVRKQTKIKQSKSTNRTKNKNCVYLDFPVALFPTTNNLRVVMTSAMVFS
jgi:hypothetical protein